MSFLERFRIIHLKKSVFNKKCVFADLGIPKCSKISLQIDFGGVFYTKPHQKITPDSLVTSELPENLKIRPKSTRKFLKKRTLWGSSSNFRAKLSTEHCVFLLGRHTSERFNAPSKSSPNPEKLFLTACCYVQKSASTPTLVVFYPDHWLENWPPNKKNK